MRVKVIVAINVLVRLKAFKVARACLSSLMPQLFFRKVRAMTWFLL
jgi:hypothetical protein